MENLIRGDVSIGGILQKNFNLKAIPSPNFKNPGTSNYYSGGYISQRYGTNSGFRLNSVQIELPASLRAANTFRSTAKQLAEAIFEFYNLHNFSNLILLNKK